jgi:hypothetical protein
VFLDVIQYRSTFFFDDGQPKVFGVLGYIGLIASHEQERILEEYLQTGQCMGFGDQQTIERLDDLLKNLGIP